MAQRVPASAQKNSALLFWEGIIYLYMYHTCDLVCVTQHRYQRPKKFIDAPLCGAEESTRLHIL